MKQKMKKVISLVMLLVFLVMSVTDYTQDIIVYAAQSDITIHFKTDWGGADIFYWSQNGKYDKNVRWTGKAMSAEGDDWYVYTFENTSSAEFMFNYQGK